MNIYILEGNIDKAKEIGNKLLFDLNVSSFESIEFSNLSNNNSSDSTQFEFWTEQMSIRLALSSFFFNIQRNNYTNIY